WETVTQALYTANNTTSDESDGWRDKAYTSPFTVWETTTSTLYNANNTTSDETDGWRNKSYTTPFSTWESTTLALYTANNTTTDATDGWRQNKLYSSPYSEWDIATPQEFDAGDTNGGASSTDGWRSNEASLTQSTISSTVIARLIDGTNTGVVANATYSNAETANMYVLPDWSKFGDALAAVALAECGGTLTLRTNLGTGAAPDPFTYQNTARTNADGQPVTTDLKVVTTTRQFVSGTFDFKTDGRYETIEIQPQNISDLTAYTPVSWSCKAGLSTRTFTTFPIPGTPWVGIRVRVAPNEAVSCTQTVARP
ncbi:unnamed protein product, partial [Phaeothamnion confervicola]